MKKVAVFVILLLAIIAIASVGYLMRTSARQEAATLVPADTILFLELPDIGQTRQRWKKTSLYQIAHEPEVQALMERPKSRIPQQNAIRANTDRVLRINPTDAFVALTSVSEQTPKFVAGFSFKGPKQDVDSLLADVKARAQAAWPAGKSDIVKYGSGEIETFTNANTVIATAYKQNWCFLSDDLDLLKAVLDRVGGKPDPKTLRSNAAFQKSLARLPKGSDALLFAQPQTVVDRLIGLVKATGQQVDTAQLEELRKIEGISAATKLEGEQIRDAMFVLKPGSERQSALARNSLAFSSTDTLIYFAGLLGNPSAFKLPDPALDTTGVLRALAGIEKGLAAQGLTLADFVGAFGPETGSVVGWAANAPQPGLLLSIDVRDPAKARKFVDFFTSGQLGTPAWAAKEIDGAKFYSLQQQGIALVTPTIAVTDKVLLAGLSFDSVSEAMKRAASNAARLDRSPLFQQAEKSVVAPTAAFGYIDSRALFERLYGTLRPFLMYWSLFVPKSSEYVDLTKLPSTEAIGKHLSPIVYSKATDENGAYFESVGPVTFNEALVSLGAGVGAAAVPMLKNYMHTSGGQPATGLPPISLPTTPHIPQPIAPPQSGP